MGDVMRAVVIKQTAQDVMPNVELVCDWPKPVPGPSEVLIQTEASALNQLDIWVGRGHPSLGGTYPRISGSDGVGRVTEVGSEVDPKWIDRRVILNAGIAPQVSAIPGVAPVAPDYIMIGKARQGTHAGYFVAPAANVLDIGQADAVDAAAFGLVFLTAWRMLSTRARLRAGQTVLITGIGGGVALASLAIAHHFGCRTIVTSRHQEKLDRAIQLGADVGILDTDGNFSKEVRQATAKRGVDVCADSVGEAIHLSCIKSLARGGTYVTCGATTGPSGTTDLDRIFWNQLNILGSTMGDMDDFREVLSLFLNGSLRPCVDTVYSPDEAAQAYGRIEASAQFGKIVIDWT